MLTDNRIDQFKADVASVKPKGARSRRDNILQGVGLLLMIVGVVVAFVVYQSSTDEADPRNIQSEIILAITMLALSVIGAALFISASLARFFSLWLLRQIYENQENAERVAAAMRRDSVG